MVVTWTQHVWYHMLHWLQHTQLITLHRRILPAGGWSALAMSRDAAAVSGCRWGAVYSCMHLGCFYLVVVSSWHHFHVGKAWSLTTSSSWCTGHLRMFFAVASSSVLASCWFCAACRSTFGRPWRDSNYFEKGRNRKSLEIGERRVANWCHWWWTRPA